MFIISFSIGDSCQPEPRRSTHPERSTFCHIQLSTFLYLEAPDTRTWHKSVADVSAAGMSDDGDEEVGHPLDQHYNIGKKRTRQDADSEDVMSLVSEDEEGMEHQHDDEYEEADDEEGEIEAHEIMVLDGDDSEEADDGEEVEVIEMPEKVCTTAATGLAVTLAQAAGLALAASPARAGTTSPAVIDDQQAGEQEAAPAISRKKRRRSEAAAAAAASRQQSTPESLDGDTDPSTASADRGTRSIANLTSKRVAPVGVLLIDDLSELTRDTEISKLLRVPRYFDDDFGTTGGISSHSRCFRCGEIGHFASDCTNKLRLKPCYLCAQLGHDGGGCPNRKFPVVAQAIRQPDTRQLRKIPS